MSKKIFFSVFMVAIVSSTVAVFVCFQGSSIAWAELDPEKVLVGTWEGTVELPRDNGRTIIIQSVKSSENGWVGEGFFATSESKGKGQRMTFDISRQGDDIIVQFVTNQKNPGKLKLLDERHMEGTMNFVVIGRTTNRLLKLEKVDKTAPN